MYRESTETCLFLSVSFSNYSKIHILFFKIEPLIIARNRLWPILSIKCIFNTINFLHVIYPVISFIPPQDSYYLHHRSLFNVVPDNIVINPWHYQSNIQHLFLRNINLYFSWQNKGRLTPYQCLYLQVKNNDQIISSFVKQIISLTSRVRETWH